MFVSKKRIELSFEGKLNLERRKGKWEKERKVTFDFSLVSSKGLGPVGGGGGARGALP